MAKRSDFAQKLLDDLRLRKERMAASSQSSNRSNSMAIIDAYSYAKQNYRGSKDMRTNDMIGSRIENGRTKSNISSRSSISGEAAQHIVPYGRGQGSQQRGDLSMALAFALENVGKIKRTDSSTRSSMLGFLQQFGMRPIDLSKMERRSSGNSHRPSTSHHFPAFSPLQIEEISKGAQRLNQILRACSNGLNFDRYSIEIGKELLQGAIDLENSLKMLVNLQEASEYMVTPQRKNRIKLLEEGEEDDEESTVNVAEEWKLDLPRFSFDKSSRHSVQELGRTGLNQRLPALSNSVERTNSSSRSISHSRSASYSSNVKSVSAFSEHKNQPSSSESKPEKARIPNVIAKLMGLDKLPKSENQTNTVQKNSGFKPKDGGERLRKLTQEAAKIVGQKAKGVENQAPPKKQKMVEANKNHVVQNTPFVFVQEKKPPANFNFEVVFDDDKLPWENSQGSKSVTRSEKTTMRKDEHQNVVVQIKQNTITRVDIKEKERNQEIKKHMEAQAHNSFEGSPLLQQKRQAEKQSSSGQKKTQNNNREIQQPLTLRKSVSEERDQSVKQISLARKHKGSEVMSKSLKQNQEKLTKKSTRKTTNSIQSERFTNGSHQDNQMKQGDSAELDVDNNLNNWKPDQNLSPRVQPEPELRKERTRVPPVMDEKAVHVPIMHKAKVATKVQKIESTRRIDEIVARRNGTLNNMSRPLRHQNSVLKEVKPRRFEKVSGTRPEEAETHISKSDIEAANDELTDLAQEMNIETEKPTTLSISKKDDFLGLKEPETQAPNDTSQNVIPNDQHDRAPLCEDQELLCRSDVANELDGNKGETADTNHEITIESVEPSKPELEPLTESENHLKHIIIKSQLFLNTADALFKLDNIPIDILHDHQDQHDNHEDRKLILDCGYELMRRKGRRQEVAVHPCVKVSKSFVKITTFDGLVRELSKGFEKLRLYGRNGKEDCEADEYLPRMLESDVYNKDPDVNCMWDMGWNESMVAFIEVDEVVRDVEKHLLNGLLDDITGELLFRSMSVH